MKALFIGGPAAGKMIEVDSRLSMVAIPASKPAGYYSPREATKEVDSSFSYRHYYRITMTDNTGKEHVAFADPDCDPLLTLMNFYAEAKHS